MWFINRLILTNSNWKPPEAVLDAITKQLFDNIIHWKIELCSHNNSNVAINIPGDKKVFKKLESIIWLFQYRFCSIVARILWFGQLCPYTIKETISFADHDWTNNIFWSNGKYDGPSMKYGKNVSFYWFSENCLTNIFSKYSLF